MAVKHKVVECVDTQGGEARLALILRALQNNQYGGGQELLKLYESLVITLGAIPVPPTCIEYMKFIRNLQKFQRALTKCSASQSVSLLRVVYNCISYPTKNRHPAMSLILEVIEVDTIPTAVRWILRSGPTEENLREALMTLCRWLMNWTYVPNLGPLVLCFMEGLDSEQHYGILIDVSLKCIEGLFKLLNLIESRSSVGPVIFYMLSSMQHTPAAFHKIIPHVGTVLRNLQRDHSEMSEIYVRELMHLCVALMDHFPGYPALYGTLMQDLQPFRFVLDVKPMLSYKPWLNEANFVVTTHFTPGKVGLNNLGNTCYMNSVLQALFMTKIFRNEILLKKQSLPLFSQLQILFALLQHSSRSSLSPSDILQLSRPPGFHLGHQHDSSEFLGYLLDVLHEQERTVESALHTTEVAQTGASAVVQGTTIVQRSFGGRAVTVSRCGQCGTQSERADNFRELQLSFPSNCDDDQSVQILLDFYLQPEKLWGDNQYHCDNCHGLTDGERVTRVVEPPSRLVLTLKNFRYDPMSQQRTKLMKRITLDASIQLEATNYLLYAAVVHCGANLDSGHYYTFAKDIGNWYKFNDCVVMQTTADELCGVKPPETPYILFYRKQDSEDPEVLPRSLLSSSLESVISNDNAELRSERKQRSVRTNPNRHNRDDDPPPPPNCGGGGFSNNGIGNAYIC